MELNVNLTQNTTIIDYPKGTLKITITSTERKLPTNFNGIVLQLKEQALQKVGTTIDQTDYDQLIFIEYLGDMESEYFNRGIINMVLDQRIQLQQELIEQPIPSNFNRYVNKYVKDVAFILTSFGLNLFKKQPAKKPAAKAQHRWNKAVSTREFFVDNFDSTATVLWSKRNQMVIKAGATMNPTPPLNKDGSLGFSARFAEQLRNEHQNQYQNFITTEDIILKSVNEVGLFLYFGGTNSWLILKDADGQTIDSYTRV